MDDVVYGHLIVLGTNGRKNWKYSDNKKETNKLKVIQRKDPNGIKQKKVKKHKNPEKSHAVSSKKIHAVSYEMSRSEAYVVEYGEDQTTDMYQIGRCTEDQIDFVVNSVPLEGIKKHTKGNNYSETVSRYACRIIIKRNPPYEARIFAAGFDSDRNIFLGENAIKWEDDTTIVDGFTTNGVMIRHPDQDFNALTISELPDEDDKESEAFDKNLWREVSVSGAIYSCLSRRGVPLTQAKLNESNILQDGTLIDLCGVTLIWRSNYVDSEIEEHITSMCGKLNQSHILCPVGYQTLKICPEYSTWHHQSNNNHQSNGSRNLLSSSKHKHYQQLLNNKDSQPFVYMTCGHVHGNHHWKAENDDENNRTCPLCKQKGPFIQLRLGQETGFFLDLELPSHCFNPCGHMASEATVQYWYRLPLPNSKSTEYTYRCPFCYRELLDKSPVRLFFHDTD